MGLRLPRALRAFATFDKRGVTDLGKDRLRSYRAAINVIGNAADQTCGRWLNNRAENSHQPFRRREGAMGKSIHNHFNHDRHLSRRDIFK